MAKDKKVKIPEKEYFLFKDWKMFVAVVLNRAPGRHVSKNNILVKSRIHFGGKEY